jgi:hypothetical protein
MNIDKFFNVFRALAEGCLLVIFLASSSEGIGDNIAINKCDHCLDSCD